MTAKPSSPRMKSRVPSIGSTIQTRARPRREPSSGISSDSTTSSGNSARSLATISALAAWSALVTGSSPALLSTISLPPPRKVVTSAAASTAMARAISSSRR